MDHSDIEAAIGVSFVFSAMTCFSVGAVVCGCADLDIDRVALVAGGCVAPLWVILVVVFLWLGTKR